MRYSSYTSSDLSGMAVELRRVENLQRKKAGRGKVTWDRGYTIVIGERGTQLRAEGTEPGPYENRIFVSIAL